LLLLPHTSSLRPNASPDKMRFTQRSHSSLEQLQIDLDLWLEEYNQSRPHSGKYCFGKTPWQTFLDTKQLAHDKQLDRFPVETSPDHLSPRAARAVSVG